MNKLVLAVAVFLLATQFACAATPKGATLTCANFNFPLDSFYLELSDATGRESQFLTITTDLAQFESLFTIQVTGKHLSSCSVVQNGQRDDQSLRMTELYVSLVSLTGTARNRYVTATFEFSKIQIPASSTSSAASSPSATPMTPEEKNHALTEFMARAPKPANE